MRMSSIKTIHELLIHELRDLYNAEKQIAKGLPKMAKHATSPALKALFESHLEETQNQIERLDRVFEELDTSKRGEKCEATEGLIEEVKEVMSDVKTPEVLDAALIIQAQKIEHYEISGYGSVRTLAEGLGLTKIATLLEETLREEKGADQKLNEVAMSLINPRAERKAA